VISPSSRSGHEGNTRVVMDNIGLLSQQGRKDDGAVLLSFITCKRFTESETEPVPPRILHPFLVMRQSRPAFSSQREASSELFCGEKYS